MSRVLAKSSYFLLEFSTKTRLGVLGAVSPFVQRPAEAHHQQDLCPRLPRHGEPRPRWPSKKILRMENKSSFKTAIPMIHDT